MTKDKICFDSLIVESVSFYKIKAKIQCKTITALHDLKINDNCECDSQSAEKNQLEELQSINHIEVWLISLRKV